jgi:hypothetical protein
MTHPRMDALRRLQTKIAASERFAEIAFLGGILGAGAWYLLGLFTLFGQTIEENIRFINGVLYVMGGAAIYFVGWLVRCYLTGKRSLL